MLRVKHEVIDGKEFIKVSATGEFDLEASRGALKELLEDPKFSKPCDILCDLSDAECALTVTDIFMLVQSMTEHRSAFQRKIAVLVSSDHDFDKAKFMELCAENRGLQVQAFDEPAEAEAWLSEEGDRV